MSGSRFIAACVQLSSGVSVAANLATIARALSAAKGLAAQCVFLPEGCNLMQLDSAAAYREARFARRGELRVATKENKEGDASLQDEVSFLASLAKKHGLWLHAGSLILRHESVADRLVNRSLLFSAAGEVVARYDKINMFDVDLPHGESYRESSGYVAGTRAVLARLPWDNNSGDNNSGDNNSGDNNSGGDISGGNLGMSICYDLRFPRLYRHLAESGALFFAVPSAFTKTTGAAHWQSLLRARAIENGCFVFAAAQSGLLQDGRSCWGRSMIVSPWGEILVTSSEASERAEDFTIITAEIDVAQVAIARKRIPALQAERPFQPCL